jgi:uridine phosphorylase
MHWYENDGGDTAFAKAVSKQIPRSKLHARPYVVACDPDLAKKFQTMEMKNGNTITNVGFYGPQSRKIRLEPAEKNINTYIADFNFEGHKITNLEMETAAIYGISALLGHNALSLNAIIANRANGSFSEDPYKAVDELIAYTLNKIASE